MLTDKYNLPLSTASAAARDAYVEGCEAKLTMYPGAIEAFDRAIAADPGFALAHAAKAHALLESGDAAASRASMAAANALTAGLFPREASHVGFFDLLLAGEAEAALAALREHLDAWPRDAVALATTAFTNGLIGSSGRVGQKRILLDLLERLAPSYGDDWWTSLHAAAVIRPAPWSRRWRVALPLSNGAISPPRSRRWNRSPANSNASAAAAPSSTWWSSRCSRPMSAPTGRTTRAGCCAGVVEARRAFPLPGCRSGPDRAQRLRRIARCRPAGGGGTAMS
jgi:tetratricopeptide (TPR) repeat protein